MKKTDKKLIILAVVVFIGLLVVRVLPMFNSYYQQLTSETARLEKRIERYQRLLNDEPVLIKRERKKAEEIAQLENWAFTGNTPNLIGSNVQRELRKVVTAANVNVREMRVAEYTNVDEWLAISQEMTFTIEISDMIVFLNLLAESMPRLHITEFSINKTRRQFNGTLTVTAFSHKLESDGAG